MSASPPPASGLTPLTHATQGDVLTIRRLDTSESDAVRLKRMGICEGRQVQLLQAGDPLILHVVGCRVGVSQRLARDVQVERCSDAEDCSSLACEEE